MNSPNKTTFSFEIFPPKPTSEPSVIYGTLDALQDLKPDFISVTYGAGGGANCKNTVGIASYIQNTCQTESVAHLPCLYLSESDLNGILEQLRENGIHNILALRGDRSETATPNGRFSHANELISYIHDYDSSFHLMAACYPEGHVEAPNKNEDIINLKKKVEAGCEFLTTQMFFDNNIFFNFLYRVREQGIDVPVIPGIMPITRAKQVETARDLSGCSMPQRFLNLVDRFGSNPKAMEQAGIAYATDQIIDLIANGINHIHVYSMNKPQIAEAIQKNLSEILK